MKSSEQHKEYAKEMFFTGIAFIGMGLLWLVAISIPPLMGVEMKLPWAAAAAVSLTFFGGAAWAFFVEYAHEKDMQQQLEKGEAEEEALRQKQILKN